MSEPATEGQQATQPKPKSSRKKSTASRKKSTASRKATTSRKTASRKTVSRKTAARERKTQPLSAALISRVKKASKSGKTLQEIADSLNRSKETTARGLPWTTQNVWHVLKRK